MKPGQPASVVQRNRGTRRIDALTYLQRRFRNRSAICKKRGTILPKPLAEQAKDSISILGVEVAVSSQAEALRRIEALADAPAPSMVVFVNAHTVNVAVRNHGFRSVLAAADIVLNDGIGMEIAARLQGRTFRENLNGSDFLPLVLDLASRRGWRVYLLGGRTGVAGAAARALRRANPELQVCGVHHGFFDPSESTAVVDDVRRSRADMLLVGMGNPAQELWLSEWLPQTGARVGIGVGAFFDFQSGKIRRAPQWMNRAGFEWAYRLLREPRRLARRYLFGIPLFLLRVAGESLRPRFRGER
jgi:exopolysaccharide biosynthesis WecB/TagA/CpsF family protein